MNSHTLFVAEKGEEALQPFIKILENGEPEDGFEEREQTSPAKVAIAQHEGNSEHRWDGYLKIEESANYYFRVDADDAGSITIDDKGFTVSTGGGSLSTQQKSVYLERGYHRCHIQHNSIAYEPAENSYEGFVALTSRYEIPEGQYVKYHTDKSKLAEGDGIQLVKLYHKKKVAKCPCEDGDASGGSCPESGSVELTISFGRSGIISGVPLGRLKLHEETLEENSFTRQAFSYEHVSMRHVKEATAQRVVVVTENGDSRYYRWNEQEQNFQRSGTGQIHPELLRMLDAQGQPYTGDIAGAYYLEEVTEFEASYRYLAETGKLESYRTGTGIRVSVEDMGMEIIRDADDAILQIYNVVDGLLQLSDYSARRILVQWFPASAVGNKDLATGLYAVTGGARKQWNMGALPEEADLPEVPRHFELLEQRGGTLGAPVYRSFWTWIPANPAEQNFEDHWEFTRGEGSNSVTTTKLVEEISANVTKETTLSLDAEGNILSREVEVNNTYAFGDCVTRRESGMEPDIRITEYEYCLDRASSQYGRMIRMTDPRGLIREYEYDAEGREIRSSSPWVGGGFKVKETTWSDSAFNDWRPVTETEKIVSENGTETVLNTTTYAYEETGLIKRETVTRTGLHCPHAATSTTEWYGRDEENVYARGRLKLVQGEDGVQTAYAYEGTSDYGAAYKCMATQMAANEIVPGKSTRDITWYNGADRVVARETQVHTGEEFESLGVEQYELDETGKVILTLHADGRSSSTIWDCCGNPLEEIDINGISTRYEYDAGRRLIRQIQEPIPVLKDYNAPYPTLTKPLVTTEYIRDAAGRVVEQITITGDPEDKECQRKRVLTTYDSLGRTLSSSDPLGCVTRYSYSPDGLVTSVTEPAGATRITTYHPDGSLLSETGTGRQNRYYSYELTPQGIKTTVRVNAVDGPVLSESMEDGWGRIVSSAESAGNGAMVVTETLYNEQGRIARREKTGNAPILMEYDVLGNVTRQCIKLSDAETADPLRDRIQETEVGYIREFNLPVPYAAGAVYYRTVETVYNAQGQPLVMEHRKLVSTMRAVVPGESLLTEHTVSKDVRGNVSESWTLDKAGNLVSWSRTPGCAQDARTISVDGELLQSMGHDGVKTYYAHRYLPEGDLMQVTDGRGNVSVTQSNLKGQAVSIQDTVGNATVHQYDTVTGLLLKTVRPDGAFSEYSYDVRGRKTAQYGTAEQPALFEYDEADRMTALTTFRVSGSVVTDNPSDRVDGDRTEWAYDPAAGLLLKKTYADGSHEDDAYDDLGQLILTTKPDGKTIARSYVPLTGELAAITYGDNTKDIAYAYNHLGQVTKVTDALGTRTFSYNRYGEKEREQTSGLYASVLIWKRDDLGRSSGYTLSYHGGLVQDITLAYDDEGRLHTALTDAEEIPFTWDYDPASGLLSSLDYPNPLKKLVIWDEHRNLVSKLDYWRPNGTNSPVKHEYDYDLLGRVVQKRDYWNTSNPGRRHSYTYNDRGELTGDRMVPGTSLAYAYDNIGNRENVMDQGQKTYQSNMLNQYTDITQGQVSFLPEYDVNGNQVVLKTSTGEWTVLYNAENRPVNFTHRDGQISVVCVYDHMGRRVEKAVYNNEALQKKLQYVYNGYLQIAELDATKSMEEKGASLAKTYFWDPSEAVATRALSMGLWNEDGSYKETIYLTHDLQKNVTAAFGILGGRRALWEYGPYGNIINSSGNIDGINSFLYSSEYDDDELGLIYYNYRYLNTLDGRWINRDPVGEQGGWNLYAFLMNQLTNYFDQVGLWKKVNGEKHTWCAEKGDTLQKLAREQKGDEKDYECLWPVGDTKDNGYKSGKVLPLDEYDASNLSGENGKNLQLRLDPNLTSYKVIFPSSKLVDPTTVAERIRKTSQEGKTPISYLALAGHGGIAGKFNTHFFSFLGFGDYDTWKYFNMEKLAEMNKPASFERAKQKKGPVRCWFTREAKVIFSGCSSINAAQPFANQFLRKEASAWGTTKIIGTGIDEKGNPIMASNIQYLNEEKTLYKWLTQEPYWLSHVWKTVNGSL